MIDILSTFCEIDLRRMPWSTFDESTLMQVMALGAVRQQAITWANVDPDICHHMPSLHHKELNHTILLIKIFSISHRIALS